MQQPADLPPVVLKAKEELRIKTGHLWVYSNEIDTHKSPLRQFQPGEQVRIVSAQQQFLGYAYINPHTLLCARILSQRSDRPISTALIKARICHALALREQIFPQPYYRLIHGEGDYLPGLVVDRYNDILVCQFNTVGISQLRNTIVQILIEQLDPQGVLVKSDHTQRQLEGLDEDDGVVYGAVPEDVTVVTTMGAYLTPLRGGQKTGWYFDHADNRKRLASVQHIDQALDLFCYTGCWGVTAALHGARSVTCVDSSQTALDYVTLNAQRNGVADRVQTLKGDVMDVVKTLCADKQRYNLLMNDPPAFIKKKKDAKQGLQAYRRLNELVLRLSAKDSFLFTSSCSHHLAPGKLEEILRQSGKHVDRQLQLLHSGQQAVDHPTHPAMPETHYLKCLFYRCLAGGA